MVSFIHCIPASPWLETQAAKVNRPSQARSGTPISRNRSKGKGMELILVVILGVAAIIGLWALAGLLVAAVRAGGVRQLLRAWLKAVTGR